MKMIFIAWAPTGRRSESLSKELKAKLYLIHYKFRKKIYAPFKYFYLFIKTFAILLKEKPDLIFAQNPPLFCPLTCLIYAKLFRKRVITDTHTGPWKTYLDKFWYWNKFIMKNSDITIVTNKYIKNLLGYDGIKFFVLEDRIPELPKTNIIKLKKGFNIVVVNTFSQDEHLEEVLKAAEKLQNVNFYITGNLIYAKSEFIKNKPKNVFYTDFLPENKYVSLLRSADGVMTLTTRNYTMLCGAHESVAVKKPMIISNWPILKKYFNMGAIYTDNSSKSIVNAVKLLMKNKKRLESEVKNLYKIQEKTWKQTFEKLMKLIKIIINHKTNGEKIEKR